MFPYRRNGGKKRGKGAPNPRQQQQQHPRDGRRLPGSAAELLPMLQPTTKALAQMLAGNTKQSGQLVNARNILAQAQRLVEERALDRLPPAMREEFLEQLARLKLTLADAEEAGLLQDLEPVAEAKPAMVVGRDLLRDVARRLAMSETAAPVVPMPPLMSYDDPVEEEAAQAEPAPVDPARGERLRLRISNDPSAPAPVRARDRLRLRSLKPASGSSGE